MGGCQWTRGSQEQTRCDASNWVANWMRCLPGAQIPSHVRTLGAPSGTSVCERKRWESLSEIPGGTFALKFLCGWRLKLPPIRARFSIPHSRPATQNSDILERLSTQVPIITWSKRLPAQTASFQRIIRKSNKPDKWSSSDEPQQIVRVAFFFSFPHSRFSPFSLSLSRAGRN